MSLWLEVRLEEHNLSILLKLTGNSIEAVVWKLSRGFFESCWMGDGMVRVQLIRHGANPELA